MQSLRSGEECNVLPIDGAIGIKYSCNHINYFNEFKDSEKRTEINKVIAVTLKSKINTLK